MIHALHNFLATGNFYLQYSGHCSGWSYNYADSSQLIEKFSFGKVTAKPERPLWPMAALAGWPNRHKVQDLAEAKLSLHQWQRPSHKGPRLYPKASRLHAAGRSEGKVKRERMFSKLHGPKKLKGEECKFFVFCEKTGSNAQFQAEPNSDVNHAVERMAGLLAVQCLVRGHTPDDFMVLVPADPSVSGRMLSRAKELLTEGKAAAAPPSLSPRQNEILHSVIRNQANKEIASHLNITVRTVKFHISSLLSKFGVENRSELARRASGLMETIAIERTAPVASPLVEATSRTVAKEAMNRLSMNVPLRPAAKPINLRFPGSALSA